MPGIYVSGYKKFETHCPSSYRSPDWISHGKKIGASADQPVKENKLLAVTVLDLVYNDPFGRRRISISSLKRRLAFSSRSKKVILS